MNLIKSFLITGLIFALALILLIPLPLAAKDKVYVGETITWTISNSQVVDYGKTSDIEDGTLTLEYIVEANAFSENAPITNGLFRATITAFSPKEAKIHQKPGFWYLKVRWEIMDKNATREKLKEKHNESMIKGFLTAELPFNPVTGSGTINALADLPLTLVGRYWAKASGRFLGNELFEGNMNLTFNRWQKIK